MWGERGSSGARIGDKGVDEKQMRLRLKSKMGSQKDLSWVKRDDYGAAERVDHGQAEK